MARRAVLLLATSLLAPAANAQVQTVVATVETAPVPSSGDAADDPAIWIHPTDPAKSRVVGVDKHSGIAVYDLSGAQLQFRADGDLNNIDLRYDFPLGAGSVDIVAGSNRSTNSISIYKIDPTTGLLTDVDVGNGIPLPGEPYGFCMYKSPASGLFYAIVNAKSGLYQQYELADNGQGQIVGTLVRSFNVASQPEGCVADDELQFLYVGEEAVGIWKYPAEPGDPTPRILIDDTGTGHLAADVEGLGLYYASDGDGYLLASSQGANRFEIYERQGANAYVGTFVVGAGGGIDGVQETDGIDVTNVALAPGFPSGFFIAQDGVNDVGNQNYKLVPWESIAQAFTPPLSIDTSHDPRGGPAACDNGEDDDGDGRTDLDDPGCSDADDDDEMADCGQGVDSDDDGACDDADNCLLVFNESQLDSDQDGYGNRCDADYDGNGVVGSLDFILFRASFPSFAGQAPYDERVDNDGNGIVGGSDFVFFREAFLGTPGPSGLACAGTPPCP